MSSQFLRAKPYSIKKIKGVLDEADRQPNAISHIEKPLKVEWYLGSRDEVDLAVRNYMLLPTIVQQNSGKYQRAKRKDHRCLTAGVSSWPVSIAQFISDESQKKERFIAFRKWRDETLKWLAKQFGDNLKGICLHYDESHLHIHFFVVGDAQRIHPGLRAELVDNVRIENPPDRYAAHKKGLKAWLDDYHLSVCKPLGLARNLNSKPVWRVKDRRIRAMLIELDKIIAEFKDEEIQRSRDELWDASQKSMHEKMRF